jgi:ATP-binding cassette subfamily C (CFTR/MRP) protein 1
VIYFSASSILNLPRLHSLWLIESTSACRGLWTSITIFTVFALFTESASKANIVRSSYHITKEQLCNLWGRSFFTWLFPFFQLGYSKIITLDDIPSVDDELTGEVSQDKLQASWKVTQGKHRLLKACLHAFLRSFLSGIPPRLALLGFTFAQPFLITATIDYMSSEQTEDSKKYGQALVGAYVVTYAGITVSREIRSWPLI